MSNRHLTPNQAKTNHRRLSHQARTIIAAILLSGGMLTPGMLARANSPAPGTIIENQATGSFVDPNDSSTQLIESNVVQVEVAEVAGITVSGKGYTEPNDGTVNESEIVYADFVITNVGNDPTQFVIPDTASITNGTQAGSIQIIEYDADGPGAGTPEDLSGSNITVTGGSDNTGNLLNGVPNTNNGSIPVGGSITVRVPVTAGNAGDDLTVVLGDTALANGQNEAYVAGTNDVYTQDNSGTDNGDTAGAPVNGEREASNSLTVQITTASNPNQTIDATPSATSCAVQGGTLSGANLFTPLDNGTMGFENGDPDQSPDINPYPGVISGGIFVQYGPGSPGHGEYAYIANMQNARNNFQHEGITDPIYGATGRFFVSDPNASTPTMTVTLTGLTPNQFYEYSFWAANAEPSQTSSNNNIDILIDGESVYSTGTLPAVEAALAWKKHTFTFTNGPNTSITVDLKSTKTGSGGNDFNLDNIELRECNFAIDYGDAPSSYGDALHTTIPLTPTVYLGATSPDSELATPSGTANGDDNTGDDEDAFTTLPDIPTTGTYDLTNIPVINTSGDTATLHAWIDFDQDGKFSASEYQSTTVANGISTANLSWTVPGGVTAGNTYARLRITQNELIEDDAATTDVDERSQDAVINGEVEDYQVAIISTSVGISGNLFVDANGNDLFEDPASGGSEAILPENITVRLLSSDGTTELDTVVTDTNGFYSFTNLTPDTYQVAVETTDPEIPSGLNIGTTSPLTVVANTNVTDQDFGFDLITSGGGVDFCQNPNGEVYSGGIANDIYAIHAKTGATFRVTNTALAGVVNSLATDHVNRKVYYAEGQAIYAWDPINNTHVRLQDSSGNLNASAMLGGNNITTLSSGGAAFYNGALYLGIEIGDPAFPSNSDTEVYRVDFAPGSNGLTIQGLTALGVNDNTGGANGGLDDADWGDMIISDTGILYGATRFVGSSAGTFWSFNLSTGNYSLISNNYLGQLAKDGEGNIWGLSDTGAIQQVDVNTGSLFGTASPTSSAIADMGECVVGFSTIGDRVWDDLDGDGVQDTLEPGIANVTVGLYRDLTGNGVIDGSDPLLTSQVTNASGNYDFVDLIPGTYIVRILEGTADDLDGSNVLDGAVLTTTSTTPGGQQAINLLLGTVDYNDADFGYQLPVIPQNPNVLLVKRITQINNSPESAGGDDLSGYINQDDATNPYDDNDITVADPVNPTDPPKDTDQWPDPNTNLIGGIDGGNVMPNDEIEYTIYYLSSGDATAESVLFCDYVPTFTSFIPNGYTGSTPQASGGIGGADLSIELYRDGSTDYHTGANDGDSATYFGPGIDPANSFPDIDCDGDGNGTNANPNGAVVVNLGDLPDATSDATGAYGYVRFRTRVK